jgi:hypothetical protein
MKDLTEQDPEFEFDILNFEIVSTHHLLEIKTVNLIYCSSCQTNIKERFLFECRHISKFTKARQFRIDKKSSFNSFLGNDSNSAKNQNSSND